MLAQGWVVPLPNQGCLVVFVDVMQLGQFTADALAGQALAERVLQRKDDQRQLVDGVADEDDVKLRVVIRVQHARAGG